jgi:hypothetical protein
MANDSHYKAVPVGVNETVTILGSRIGGFLPATDGSIQIIIRQFPGPDVTLPVTPVVAGDDVDIPIFIGTDNRSTFVASGGASGTLFVA